jgi:hypothetical protein
MRPQMAESAMHELIALEYSNGDHFTRSQNPNKCNLERLRCSAAATNDECFSPTMPASTWSGGDEDAGASPASWAELVLRPSRIACDNSVEERELWFAWTGTRQRMRMGIYLQLTERRQDGCGRVDTHWNEEEKGERRSLRNVPEARAMAEETGQKNGARNLAQQSQQTTQARNKIGDLGGFTLGPDPIWVPTSVSSVKFHLSNLWHQRNKKCSTFIHILDGIIIIWWKFAQMDEKWTNRMEMVKLDENFGDKKLSFWKKIAKIRIFEKKIRHLAILCKKKKH